MPINLFDNPPVQKGPKNLFGDAPTKTPATAPAAKPTIAGLPTVKKAGDSLGVSAIKNTAQIYKDAPKTIFDDLNKGNNAPSADVSKNPIIRAGENALAGTARTLETVFAPFSGAAKAVTDHISKAIEDNPAIINSPITLKIADMVNAAQDKINKQSEAHPEFARNFGNAVSVILAALGGEELNKPIGSVEGIKQGVADLAQGTKETAAKVPGKVLDAVQGIDTVKEKVSAGVDKVKEKLAPNEAKQIEAIQEKTMPKGTSKEAQLATKEGRLTKGSPETLFKAEGKDVVKPTIQQARANALIQEKIPGAYKMTEPELHTAIGKEVGNIAKELTPEMQKTPIKLETVKKLNTDLVDLQKEQLKGVYTTDEVKSVKGMQKEFSERIRKFMKGGSMDDLWKEAKDYDTSIPDKVKQANSLSSDALQKQRETWIENRNIMRKTLTDSTAGLGEKAKTAFQQMSDLYDAQEGILSKAKIETKTAPSKLSQFGKSKPGKLIKGAVKTAAAGALIGAGIKEGQHLLP